MPLSQDELKMLSRAFLTGKSTPGDIENLKVALETDPQAGIELLAQMSRALDGVAPNGFTPEQWTEVDSRVAAMMLPLSKGGGIFSKLFGWLFRSKPAPPPKPKADEPAEPEPASPPPASEIGMEEMAPIAAGPEPAVVEAPVEAAPRKTAKPRPKKDLKGLWIFLLIAALAAGLYYLYQSGAFAFLSKKEEAPPALPTPTPTPTPKTGPPERSLPLTTPGGPLPSELPELTPRPAGESGMKTDLEAKDKEGGRGFPLP